MLILLAAAGLRGAEYDEAYTVFLAQGTARPDWPEAPFTPAEAWARLAGHSTPWGIAADLRRTDVHPPLYFWLLAAWRALVGETLLATRLFSAACALAALGLVGAIARRTGVPAWLAMALTLGSYGFTYTGAIARGFALAQALNLLGIWLLLRAPNAGWALAAGIALGAACWANYLAGFIAAAALAWAIRTRGRIGWAALAGFLPMLALPLWFFLAQRASRTGQFPPFEILPALSRLARYGAANLFGGLPLYAGPSRGTVSVAVAALLAILGILLAQRWRRIEQRWLLSLCTTAPALGLLGLGLVFNNTPIELRYLAFATPFAALLLTSALARRPAITALVLTVQAAAIAGLLLRPETMQPQTAATQAAAQLAGPNGLVLLPRGNDGVGLVGSVLLSAPTDLRLALVRPTDDPAQLRGLAHFYPRLVLALLAVDGESRATLPLLTNAFTGNECWRETPAPANLRAYDNLCRG